MAKTYVSLDLETTGLDPQHDAVIEVGALRFSGSREIESFSTFVNPGRRIPQFITELTGISDADVARAPSIRQVAQELRTFVGDDTLVGHNIGFDVVNAFVQKHGGSFRVDRLAYVAELKWKGKNFKKLLKMGVN